MDQMKWLRLLCEADAPGRAADLAAEFFSPFAEVHKDIFGGVTALLRAGEDKPTLLFDAHLDTIGFLVTAVREDGFVKLGACGGLDRRTLVGAEVTVWGREPIYGVICSTPPHLNTADEHKVPSVEELLLDIGCTCGEEARKRVAPGDRVTFVQSLRPLLGNRVSGKYLDDRAGVLALFIAADRLRECDSLPCNVIFSCSEQEETGGSPAAAAAFRLRPCEAIAVDVSFAADAHTPPTIEATLDGGPMLGTAAILSRSMTARLRQLAQEAGIPLQEEVMGGRTGTNADRMVAAAEGLPCALLSIPQRNMHTPVEVVSLQDIEQTGRLLAAYAMGGVCHD